MIVPKIKLKFYFYYSSFFKDKLAYNYQTKKQKEEKWENI